MEDHPSYPVLSSLIKKYPKNAGSLFQTYNDILLAQQWRDVEVFEMGEPYDRGCITGRRPLSEETLHVVPCSLAESISIAWMTGIIKALSVKDVYLAINTEDSSIVYYKISDGIVKPSV
ncbi:hypothetical protein Moror_16217 [Moniliophthora roreri MCA 2997]|uniref:tRNA-splicing endonuclease subunit Sen15 domain-containing protein n=1 Tax=Moniliophthora roreri (strain MCA 2997) TaxID=1381753 RepID=V2YCF6_MONRO|nr:hypothetical protein Moror_16217 [Moniliophthora roreri MCA 2997]